MNQAVRQLERGCLKVFSGYRRTSKNVSSRSLHNALYLSYLCVPARMAGHQHFCLIPFRVHISFGSRVTSPHDLLTYDWNLSISPNTYILIPPFPSVLLLLVDRLQCKNTRVDYIRCQCRASSVFTTSAMFRAVGCRLFSTQASVTGLTGAVGNTPLVGFLFNFRSTLKELS